jgi:hypothetical protein
VDISFLTQLHQYRDQAQLYLIFENSDYAHILWSKNLDPGDLPTRLPSVLENPTNPGVMERMDVYKLNRMQLAFQWQPHLPYMPINLERHPWMLRYQFTYQSLPIVQIDNFWSLNQSLAFKWDGHIQFFSHLLLKWNSNLEFAPLTIDLPNIRSYSAFHRLDDEKKARGYFWYLRTLIFSMLAQFSSCIAQRPDWQASCGRLRAQDNLPVADQTWLDEVDKLLGDFSHTKRTGVVLPATTALEIWRQVPGYHRKGVLTLMHVGYVTFEDGPPNPSPPVIYITSYLYSHVYPVLILYPISSLYLSCPHVHLISISFLCSSLLSLYV